MIVVPVVIRLGDVRRRARASRLAALAPLVAVLALASGALAQVRVTLNPRSGGPATRFMVIFDNPGATGTTGSLARHETLVVNGPRSGRRCVSSAAMQLPSTGQGDRVRVMLDPKRLGGVWCVGRFAGQVIERQSSVCPPGHACPQFIIAPRTIARFTFRVRRRAHRAKAGVAPGRDRMSVTAARSRDS